MTPHTRLIPSISNEVCEILQAKPARTLILLYDLEDTKFLWGVVVDKNNPDDVIRTDSAPCVWRALFWADTNIIDSSTSKTCGLCDVDKNSGWFFQQRQELMFFCTSCLQGN